MSKCYASAVLAIAAAEIGYHEKKSNSQLDNPTANAGSANYTKYARDFDEKYPKWYNGKKNGFAWCDMFVDWCMLTAFGYADALRLLCQPERSAGAGCTYSLMYYEKQGRYHAKDPKPGDQIFFSTAHSKSNVSHTGLVEKVDGSKVYTIEGNTSDQVARRSYYLSDNYIVGYGRPAYDAEPGNANTGSQTPSGGTTSEVTYTVVKGDTWGQIANSHGMSSAELEALNPGYDINRIHIGDALTLSNAVPYLTVKVTERQNYVEDVNYDVSYVDDASMYQGDERVISKGAFGKADIVADVTYINGEEQERTVISSVTLSDPVVETRARGTKVRPTWYPTGSFRWPCSGRITSYFGYRNTGIRGATTNHKGIDIACARGTPIYAADGGRVIFSGYKGAMGYVVIIDHNNGYVTYYEHNGSLLVSAGQTVYKGQQIAKAGRSGVASGVHCHFGIQRNGSYVNPLNYLS